MKTNPPLFQILTASLLMLGMSQAQNVVLLKDINDQGATASTLADEMALAGNNLYIATDDEVVGSELWRINVVSFTGTTSAVTNPSVITSVSSTAGLVVGMGLSGSGIPAGTTITALGSGTVTISAAATATGTLVALAATGAPVLVRDIVAGPDSSQPKNLTAVGNFLYFSAADAGNERDLWRSDGTATNTLRVGNSDYLTGSGPEKLLNLNGTLLFEGAGSTANAGDGLELWKATGTTTVTTAMVKDINTDFGTGAGMSPMVAFGGFVYFRASNETNGGELWRSDGTTANTIEFIDLQTGAGASEPRSFTPFNSASGNFLYFVADGVNASAQTGEELFRTTGSLGNVELVKDIEVGAGGSSPQQLVVSGSQLYFTAFTTAGSAGRELFITDGSSEDNATQLVEDIFPGIESSAIANLTPIKVGTGAGSDRVIFTADSGASQGFGRELWISNGIPLSGGTIILKEFTSGPDGSVLDDFFRISASLVVFTKQETNGKLTLWKTDGTVSGTVQIEDFDSAEAVDAVNLRNPVLVGGTLYFMLGDDELWKTNGLNDVGTVRVHRFRTATGSSLARDFTRLSDGRVVFSAVRPAEGREVWITDGTPGGTVLVADLFPGTQGSEPADFTATTDGRFFFSAANNEVSSAPNRELFMSDGSTITKIVTLTGEINPNGSSNPQHMAWISDKLYFQAVDDSQETNEEIWRTDGTPAGTVRLDEFVVGSSGAGPDNFTEFKGDVFFTARSPTFNNELFKINGTGSTLIKDINLGLGSSDPDEFVILPNVQKQPVLYFVATGVGSGLNAAQNTGRELWKSDGTANGTIVVKDIVAGVSGSIDDSMPAYVTVVDKLIFFVADDDINGRELWKTDGTASGTTMVRNISNIAGASAGRNLGSNPTDLRSVNGKLFFLADDGVNGRELWLSNGTASGTVMVKNIVAGNGSANIQNLSVVDDVVIFTADDGITGRELWLSDGTSIGTRVAVDLIPGSTSSIPTSLYGSSGNAYFAASDTTVGSEPRFLPLASRIVVENPVSNPLLNGATVNLTPVAPIVFGSANAFTTQSFTIRNNGTNNLRNVTALISGVNAAEFTITTKPPAIIINGTPSTFVVRFTPKEGGTRSAILTILSTDPNTPSFVVNLTGTCTKDPTITTQPVSQMVNVGESLTFTAAASSATALSLQWRRNGTAIAGALSSPYKIFAAQIAQAGAYSALFKNSATPTAGTGISNNAELGVVENFIPARIQPVRLGTATATTTITFNAAGNGLTYLWKRSPNVNLSAAETLVESTILNPTKFKNVATRTLTITGFNATDSQYYFCEVTGPGGMRIGGTTQLRVFSLPPQVATTQGMPDGIVSRFYSHQIVLSDTSLERTPLTYAATNLPPGLTLNTRTGLISGRPNKAGTFDKIKVSATNGVTPNQIAIPDQIVRIGLMPTGLDGVYAGLIGRQADLNDNLGGRIDVTVTALTGALTGSLTLGTQKLSFKGGLDIGGIVPGATPTDLPTAVPPYSATVLIPRAGILAPVTLTFTIDPSTKNRFSVGQITSQDVSGPVAASVSGWKQVWKATPIASSAAPYLGLYNFGIRLPATIASNPNPNLTNLDVPLGNGYASFTVAAAGTLTIAGRTPDGESLTGGTFVGPSGEVLIYQTLYSTTRKGSIRGVLDLDTGTAIDPNDTTDNTLTSTEFDWVRPPNPAVVSATAATRTYRAGFGLPGTPVATPVELEAFGGRYVVPSFLLRITSPPPATPAPSVANASIKFTDGGVDTNFPTGAGPSREPDINAAITATHTVLPVGANAALTKITPNRTTGAVTGSFTLSDTNPRTIAPLTPNPIPRAVPFLGLIVPLGGGSSHEAVGYFMLPQLPTSDNATLVTTTRILSGKMIFKLTL